MDEIVTITDTVGLPNQMIDLSKIIYTIRGKQVMLDSDLAILYGYEVKRLNEQVKNNINRFPEDFMFQMTKEEVKDLRSKFSTANPLIQTMSVRTYSQVGTCQGCCVQPHSLVLSRHHIVLLCLHQLLQSCHERRQSSSVLL